ncbi:MAG TPA: DUF6580 family putative transport protein [Flavitalea sp.]|nr:DUF6580 family putative transport protein [Flavitalea sp.]
MSITKINPRFAVLLIFIIIVGILRVFNAAQLTAWSNFTPIGAMAMFGGAYFSQRWKSFAFPVLTLFIGDVIIHTVIYDGSYEGRPLIYIAFSIIVLIGILVIRRVTTKNIAIASLLSTISFWLTADFAVWLGGGTDIRTQLPLSRDIYGLLQCYWQGFPYMINFLLGTLFYSAIMFGLFEWIQNRFPALQIASR